MMVTLVYCRYHQSVKLFRVGLVSVHLVVVLNDQSLPKLVLSTRSLVDSNYCPNSIYYRIDNSIDLKFIETPQNFFLYYSSKQSFAQFAPY